MSHSTASIRPSPARPTVSSSGSRRRPQTTTVAPQAASSSAAARPSPDPPPLTIATWPSSRPGAKIFDGIAAGGYPPPPRWRAASGRSRPRSVDLLAERPALAAPRRPRARARRRTPAPARAASWPARTAAPPRSPDRRSPCTRSAPRPRCCPPRPGPRRRRCPRRAPAAPPRRRSRSSRAAASASPAASSRCGRRAEDAQRGVALELVHPAAVPLGGLDHELEERVEQGDRPRSGGRRAASVVDPTRSTNSTATSRTSPPSRDLAVERGVRHVPAHVPPEQVAQVLALGQAGGHPVEAGLELAHLAAVVHGHARVELALLDRGHRLLDGPHRVGDGSRRGDRGVEPDSKRPRGRGAASTGWRACRSRRRRGPRSRSRRCRAAARRSRASRPSSAAWPPTGRAHPRRRGPGQRARHDRPRDRSTSR